MTPEGVDLCSCGSEPHANGLCRRCYDRERGAAYRARTRERKRAYDKARYAEQKPVIRERQSAYYAERYGVLKRARDAEAAAERTPRPKAVRRQGTPRAKRTLESPEQILQRMRERRGQLGGQR